MCMSQDSDSVAVLTDLTGFQRDMLAGIAKLEDENDQKPHGLAIKQFLQTWYESDIHHGRLYPNLDTLVEKGLVDKGSRDRRTNTYTLSKRGEREARKDANLRAEIFGGSNE